MTTIDTRATATTGDEPAAADERSRRTEATAAWLTSTDHKRIGRLLIGSSLLAALGVAAVAAVLGIERVADGEVFDASAVPQLFTAMRYGLVFGVGLPLMLGLAVAVVPLQVGARAIAFARLAATGFWLWATGLVFVVISLANNGGPGGGDADMVDLFLAAFGLQIVGMVAVAVSVATTVLTARAPGMSMRRVPMFSWSALLQSLAVLLALPVQLGVIVYLFVDHRNDRLAFGGNTGIGRWLGFALTQPATYIVAIGAFGIALELLAVTFARRLAARSVLYAGIGLVGTAALGAVTQQSVFLVRWNTDAAPDDFNATLEDAATWALFLGLPLLGALVVMAAGGLTARGARPRISGPFVFSFLGMGMVVTGMAGAMAYQVAMLGLVGTVFEEAALVYVVYGTVLAGLGGIAFWAPKWWGSRLPDRAVLGLATLGMLATVLASLPYYAAGFADQPGGAVEFDYSGPKTLWNVAVLAGHALMLVTVAGFAALVAKVARTSTTTPPASGDHDAGDDPWGGHTLEWATSSPAPADNFADIHVVSSPEPMLDLRAEPTSGEAAGP